MPPHLVTTKHAFVFITACIACLSVYNSQKRHFTEMMAKMAFAGFNRPTSFECRRACDLLAELHGLPTKVTAGQHGICELPGPHTVLDSLVSCCCCCCLCISTCSMLRRDVMLSLMKLFMITLANGIRCGRSVLFSARILLTSHRNAPSLR